MERSHRATVTCGRRTRERAFLPPESQREKEHRVEKTCAEVMVENSPNLAKTITFRFNAQHDKPKKHVSRHSTIRYLPRATDSACDWSGKGLDGRGLLGGSGTTGLRAESSSFDTSEYIPFSDKGKDLAPADLP